LSDPCNRNSVDGKEKKQAQSGKKIIAIHVTSKPATPLNNVLKTENVENFLGRHLLDQIML